MPLLSEEKQALLAQIEALLFCCEEAISLSSLTTLLSKQNTITEEETQHLLHALEKKYAADPSTALSLCAIGGGYRLLTKKVHAPLLEALTQDAHKRKLSVSAMETLAIIAYKQPITAAEVEKIRGVNSDYMLHRLLEQTLIEVKKKAPSPGNPLLYGTGKNFLDFFGLQHIEELPPLKHYEGLPT